ncbi:MAG TPA: hypothetical protein VLX92_15270 [Kofleriaceae bacterium]|nr:hypothetical protein [Kofleriaceae bacterium]
MTTGDELDDLAIPSEIVEDIARTEPSPRPTMTLRGVAPLSVRPSRRSLPRVIMPALVLELDAAPLRRGVRELAGALWRLVARSVRARR